METLQKKTVAIGITSLVIFVSLVFIAKIQVGEALAAILVLLSVFTAIDLAAKTDILTKRHRQFACVTIGILAVAAIAVFEYLISIEPDHASTASNAIPNSTSSVTAATERKADETYDIAMSYYENGNYEEAIKTLRKVKSTSDYYTDAQELLAKITDYYYPLLMERAKTYAENGDYKMATSILDLAVLVFPGDEEMLQTLKEYSVAYTTQIRTTAIESAKLSMETGDYTGAIQNIQSAIDEVGSDVELESLMTKYTSDYQDNVFLQAKIYLQEEGYEAAVKFIQGSLNVLPNDSELLNMIEEYKVYAPVYLLEDIDYLRKDDRVYIEDQPRRDNKGNEYSGHKILYGGAQSLNYENYSILFDTSGNYNKFWGTVFLPYSFRGSTRDAYIFIYGDNSLLYKSKPMSMGFETDTFSIDISGVNIVEIVFQASPFSLNLDVEDVYGCLTDAYFCK